MSEHTDIPGACNSEKHYALVADIATPRLNGLELLYDAKWTMPSSAVGLKGCDVSSDLNDDITVAPATPSPSRRALTGNGSTASPGFITLGALSSLRSSMGIGEEPRGTIPSCLSPLLRC